MNFRYYLSLRSFQWLKISYLIFHEFWTLGASARQRWLWPRWDCHWQSWNQWLWAWSAKRFLGQRFRHMYFWPFEFWPQGRTIPNFSPRLRWPFQSVQIHQRNELDNCDLVTNGRSYPQCCSSSHLRLGFWSQESLDSENSNLKNYRIFTTQKGNLYIRRQPIRILLGRNPKDLPFRSTFQTLPFPSKHKCTEKKVNNFP